jgi:glycosyltransferase involved in cell wall biosynthesis
VPSRDRAPTLARCLDALAAQDVDGDVQVVVVDDGSSDGTPDLLDHREAIEVHRQDPRGHSAALNAGLDLARGDVVLFLDDDVLATPGLVQRHLDHHRRYPEAEAALVGRVTWAPEVGVTPHMTWLEDGGPLFAFTRIADPDDIDWRHFCTANVSIKRALLGPERFDEELERFNDAELGYRLRRRGMRLRYDARALGYHLRVDTPATTERRMRLVGRAARQVHAKHPEIAEPPPTFRALTPLGAWLGRAASPILRRTGSHDVLERVDSYRAARAYARGYAEKRLDSTAHRVASPRPG